MELFLFCYKNFLILLTFYALQEMCFNILTACSLYWQSLVCTELHSTTDYWYQQHNSRGLPLSVSPQTGTHSWQDRKRGFTGHVTSWQYSVTCHMLQLSAQAVLSLLIFNLLFRFLKIYKGWISANWSQSYPAPSNCSWLLLSTERI